MANLKRLTQRVEKVEKWIKENGDGETVSNLHYLVRSVRQGGEMVQKSQIENQNLKNLLFSFLKEKEMIEEWDTFIQESENAIQKQQTEEVSVQEKTEGSEEAVETQEEKE
tara:strand:+ start:364 stop:696 length:333 start_codon:yes stop_codon:yes gene_type:complete